MVYFAYYDCHNIISLKRDLLILKRSPVPLLKPQTNIHPSALKDFKQTSFETANLQKLDSNVKKRVNYIIGQIVLYWPGGDDIAVWAANLSLVTGHSFYYE